MCSREVDAMSADRVVGRFKEYKAGKRLGDVDSVLPFSCLLACTGKVEQKNVV